MHVATKNQTYIEEPLSVEDVMKSWSYDVHGKKSVWVLNTAVFSDVVLEAVYTALRSFVADPDKSFPRWLHDNHLGEAVMPRPTLEIQFKAECEAEGMMANLESSTHQSGASGSSLLLDHNKVKAEPVIASLVEGVPSPLGHSWTEPNPLPPFNIPMQELPLVVELEMRLAGRG